MEGKIMAEPKPNTPKLRFPEFSGKWEVKSLGEVCEFLDNKRIPIKDSDRSKMQGIYPYYGASGIIDYVNDYIFDEDLILLGEDGANIIIRSSPLAFKVSGKIWVNNHAHVLKPINHYLEYICEYLENMKYDKYNTGTAQPKLNRATCEKIPILCPSYAEQKKTADFLTSISERLDLLKDKEKELETYKTGVMQKIFSKEIRFKDENGDDYPDWEENILGNICHIRTGKLDANAMVADGKYRFYTCAKEYSFIDEYKFDTEALLISGNGANVGYIHYYKGKFNAYQRTYVLDEFSENVLFIKFFLDEFLKVRIEKEKKDSNTPYIVMGTLNDMELQLPNTSEQEKIANFLLTIDDKIAAINEQIINTKRYKKGLLQQIFV